MSPVVVQLRMAVDRRLRPSERGAVHELCAQFPLEGDMQLTNESGGPPHNRFRVSEDFEGPWDDRPGDLYGCKLATNGDLYFFDRGYVMFAKHTLDGDLVDARHHPDRYLGEGLFWLDNSWPWRRVATAGAYGELCARYARDGSITREKVLSVLPKFVHLRGDIEMPIAAPGMAAESHSARRGPRKRILVPRGPRPRQTPRTGASPRSG